MTETKKRKTRTAKDPRVNLAMQPELFDYCQTMAGLKGLSLTAFLNEVIQKNMEQNKAIYEEAQALAKKVK